MKMKENVLLPYTEIWNHVLDREWFGKGERLSSPLISEIAARLLHVLRLVMLHIC